MAAVICTLCRELISVEEVRVSGRDVRILFVKLVFINGGTYSILNDYNDAWNVPRA